MTLSPPNLPPDNVYCVKEVCAHLGTTRTTLCKLRRKGIISPLNDNIHRLKYRGEQVNLCWHRYNSM